MLQQFSEISLKKRLSKSQVYGEFIVFFSVLMPHFIWVTMLFYFIEKEPH